MASPDVPPSDDAEFQRLINSIYGEGFTPHHDSIDLQKLQPLGRAAVAQLTDESLYANTPLRNLEADTYNHGIGCSHETICGIAGFILTLDDRAPKPRVEPVLLPPSGLSSKAFLEHCRDLIRPYSHYQLGEMPLTPTTLNAFLASDALFVASVIQMTDKDKAMEVCTSLKIPSSFIMGAHKQSEIFESEELYAHGIREVASIFDWLSSLHLSAMRDYH